MNFDCKKMHPKCQAQCCGVVPIRKEIYEKHKDKVNRKPNKLMEHEGNIIPLTEDFLCPFLDEDLSCKIYEDRPDVCRKFGDESHPMLFCPHLDKNGKERCRQARRQIERNSSKYMHKLKILP